jgi:glycosyltransferase involved in cell wall biosynthesis
LRILWAKANKILPVHSGGDIRSYNIARQLAAQHELTFFSYYDGARDLEYEKALQEHFPAAVGLCTGKSGGTLLRRGWDYALRLADRAPYAVSRFASDAVQEQLKRWYEERAFDVAVCDFLDAAVNLPKELTIPTLLFQHNVESEIWRRHASNGSGRAMKLVYSLEFAKMLRYEQAAVRRFHHVAAVSEHDKTLMSAWVDPARVTVVRTGVDTGQFRPAPHVGERKPVVMFVGAMDWEPNVDAVHYFCEEIWPLIQTRIPDARFRIVGRNPGRQVRELASESVEVTGRVASVVDQLREAAVVVVPLRIGGGTRLKIYEAMAASRAVVSTSVGAEGLEVHHGQDAILADTPQAFGEAVVMLLRDPSLRRRYEEAAARLASQFDWSAIGAEFAQLLARVSSRSVPEPVGSRAVTAEGGSWRPRG